MLDGALDESVNLRHIDGALRPVGEKERTYSSTVYSKIEIHKQDSINNWIGYKTSSKEVQYYDPSTLVVNQTLVTLNATETLNNLLFLKRFAIIITDENTYIFIWKNESYIQTILTGIEELFGVDLSNGSGYATPNTDDSVDAEALLANYYKWRNESSNENYVTGGLFYRVALKLFDGSYIMHTLPKYHQATSHNVTLHHDAQGYHFTISAAKVNANAFFNQATPEQFDVLKNLVQSIVVFGSQSHILYEINEDSITDSNLTSLVPGIPSSITLSSQSLIPLSEDFKEKMYDSAVWHKIDEILLSDMEIAVTAQRDNVELTGTSGRINIIDTAGLISTVLFVNNLTDTAAAFVSLYAAQYASAGITITSSGPNIIFDNPNGTFVSPVVVNITGDLNGIVTNVIVPSNPGEYSKTDELDFEGYYQNYATRESLTVDDFSHHALTSNASKIYNDRLMIGDTLQTLADPFINSFQPATNPIVGSKTYEFDASVLAKIQIKLETSDGTKYITKSLSVDLFKDTVTPTNKAVFFHNVIGYPDFRATQIIIDIHDGADYYELFRSELKRSALYNFAFIVNESFDKADVVDNTINPRAVDTNFNSYPLAFTYAGLNPSTLPDDENTVIDNNRWPISEVNNPFVFPAENSNQVGTGVILAFGVNTERIGTSQFGQYPIIIFTSVGRWIAEIGTGDVYITRIVPLDGEVLRDKDSTLDLAFGVAYITAEGLKIAQAKEVIDISEPVEGLQDQYLTDDADLQHFINNDNTVQMSGYVDKVPFLTYLQGANIGYNKGLDHSEIIVANPNYYYAYFYDLNSKTWGKITGKHFFFIPNYPELYSQSEYRAGTGPIYSFTTGVYNLSKEILGETQCLFITRAVSLEAPDVFKKLRRTFLRSFMQTKSKKYATMYIFKSDDLKNWSFVTGNDRNTGVFKDIYITHSKNSARFYAFVFVADLNTDHLSLNNRINGIDTQYDYKRSGKLR